ncbi:18013_t:CDS:1, partial [Racocetra persica]
MKILEDLECFLETLDLTSILVPEHNYEEIEYDKDEEIEYSNEKIADNSQDKSELDSSSDESVKDPEDPEQ